MIHTAIIDDDTKLAQSICTWIQSKPELYSEGCYKSVDALIDSKDTIEKLEVLLLDIELNGISSLNHIGRIKNAFPEVEIIILSSYSSEEYIFSALRAGASSYCLKGSGLDVLGGAISQTHNSGSYFDPAVARKVAQYFSADTHNTSDEMRLTQREIDVVIGLVDGLSYKLIGNRLGISIDTVRHFIRVIYKKLQVNSKSEVIKMAYRGEIEGVIL